MKLRDVIGQAFKNIGRQKLRSALTIFAVVIGATSVTIMLALVAGAKTYFVNQFSANGTLQQVSISSQTDLTKFNQGGNGGNNCSTCVKLTDAFVTKVLAVPHVVGVARRTSSNSFQAITYNGQKLSVNQIEGYDANGIIANTMLSGRDINSSDTTGVITVSSDYADQWGFKGNYAGLVGKQIQLTSQNGYSGIGATIQMPQQPTPGASPNNQSNNPQNNPPTTVTATIVGVADASDQGGTIRAPLAWVVAMNEQQMYQQTNMGVQNCRFGCQPVQPTYRLVVTNMQQQNGYNELVAKVDDPSNAAAVTADIKNLGVGAADAESFIKAQLQIFNIVSLVLGGIGGIALFVAAIGVVNTMVMAILERTREIGVLRACGATRATIRRMFTIEAGTLGFMGGALGVAVGYGLTIIANRIINVQLAGSSVPAHNIISLPLWLIGSVIGIATLIGLLAGLYPAFRAARLNPIDALRYE